MKVEQFVQIPIELYALIRDQTVYDYLYIYVRISYVF